MRFFLLISLLIISGLAYSQNTLPPVQVTAKRIGGGDFYCRGTACSQALNAEQLAANIRFMQEHASLPDEPAPIDPSNFCPRLRNVKPGNCSVSSPPSVPDYTPGWAPNGCGIGPKSNWFLSELAARFGGGHSGNLNYPVAGVSFLSACNAHDVCWGRGMDRANCDLSFKSNMETACGGLSSPGSYNTCIGYAGAYHFAVSVPNFATSHYNQSAEEYKCAAWISDMKQNGCNQ